MTMADQSLKAENAHLRAELERLKAHHGHIVAAGIRSAITEVREAFSEGGTKWLCRVVDLEEYADRLSESPVGVPVPGGWELERETDKSITVHHPDIGCYAAHSSTEASVASIVLYHLADDLLDGR